MAVEYELRYGRDDGGSITVGGERTSLAYSRPFQCIVTDPVDPTFNPKHVRWIDVAYAAGLPNVNRTVWDDIALQPPALGLVDPWSVCTRKTAKRHPTRMDLFEGELNWDSVPFLHVADNYLTPVLSATADVAEYGAIYEPSWMITKDEVLYEDFDTPPKRCTLPTGTYYTDPFYETIPERTYRITQIETDVTLTTIENRLGRVNAGSWAGHGDPAGWWYIAEIAALRIEIPVANVPVEAFMMQYLVKKASVRPWWSSRALIDTVHLKLPNDITTRIEFVSETSGSFVEGLLNSDGTEKTDQNTAPTRETYIDLKSIDFSFFRNANNPLP